LSVFWRPAFEISLTLSLLQIERLDLQVGVFLVDLLEPESYGVDDCRRVVTCESVVLKSLGADILLSLIRIVPLPTLLEEQLFSANQLVNQLPGFILSLIVRSDNFRSVVGQGLGAEVAARGRCVVSSALPSATQVFVQLLRSLLDDSLGVIDLDITYIMLLNQGILRLEGDKIALTHQDGVLGKCRSEHVTVGAPAVDHHHAGLRLLGQLRETLLEGVEIAHCDLVLVHRFLG